MGSNAKAEFDNSAITHAAFAGSQVDLDVVVLEKCLIEWIDRFVHGFFGDEEQSPLVRVVPDFQPLLRRRDQVQQLGWQGFGRFDVYAQSANVAAHPDRRNRNAGIVGQGAEDTGRPDWRARGSPG